VKNRSLLVSASALFLSLGAAPGNGASPARNVYFGDLHLHTAYSLEVYAVDITTTPDQAYRYARGESVLVDGAPVQRPFPLDFLAISDHAEHLGVLNGLSDPDSEVSQSAIGELMRREPAGMPRMWHLFEMLESGTPVPGFDERKAFAAGWRDYVAAANANYLPGRFTTFIGYEWSGDTTSEYDLKQTNSLHRGVIFGGATAPLPFTSLDSHRPEDLWTYLEENRRRGIDVFAMANHPNLSGGLMYALQDSDGHPIDRAYAERRALNEPLSEIAQHHGNSETHPSASPEDNFADFEISERLFLSQKKSPIAGSYVREAYGQGLLLQQALGVNPFKFGVVGTSDFHNGLSDSVEGDYAGDTDGGINPRHPLTAQRLRHNLSRANELNTIDMGSAYLTAVWAEQNTRESIFAALKRKETYATSGTRLKLRFFGGWNYDRRSLRSKDWLRSAYLQGVPMGGDLPAIPAAAKAPRFIVWAHKAPESVNLDRAQIVKLWIEDGRYREHIFDVAIGGRPELAALWTDPGFDATTPAVYYLRVLELPTPRWTTIQSVKVGIPPPSDKPVSIQERGWSSPIWYVPSSAEHASCECR